MVLAWYGARTMRSKAYMVRTDGASIERCVLRRRRVRTDGSSIERCVLKRIRVRTDGSNHVGGLTMVGLVSAASLSGVAVLTVMVGQNG